MINWRKLNLRCICAQDGFGPTPRKLCHQNRYMCIGVVIVVTKMKVKVRGDMEEFEVRVVKIMEDMEEF